MRINSTHTHEDRGLDAYFTPIEAVLSLIALEKLPKWIWEPACGDGAIVKPLLKAGHNVFATDICDYGLFGAAIGDYLKLELPDTAHMDAVVTNPPFKLAQQFAEKALTEVPYVALLLRLSFLESVSRKLFFEQTNLSRILVSSRRLPMMHRYGWEGPEAPSNTCYAWFIWDHRECWYHGNPVNIPPRIKWFDWKDYC